MNNLASCSNPTGIYEPLNDEKAEIRLLKILPASQSADKVHCELVTVPLAGSYPEYIALSYVWGNPSITTAIVVNKTSIQVTTNLVSALQNIRSQIFAQDGLEKESLDLPALLWADAVCINQNDLPERGRQVQMMRMIYQRAASVISWLGLQSTGISLAISTLKLLAREIDTRDHPPKDIEWLREFPAFWEENSPGEELPNKSWMAFREFLRLPYWSRIWIIQEMVLSKKIWLMSGPNSIDFECLKNFVFWNILTIQNPQFHRPAFFPYQLWVKIANQARFSWLVVNTVILLRGSMETGSNGLDLKTILSKLFFDARYYDATDPRDKIYGLLGLTQFNISPNYQHSVRQVYCDFSRVWKHANNDLNTILQNSGIGLDNENKFGLPSWVPDFYAVAHRQTHLGHPGKISVLVHEADSKLSSFVTPESSIAMDNSLHVYGIAVDNLRKVEDHILPRDLLSFSSTYVFGGSKAEYTTGIPRLQAFFRFVLESAQCVNEEDDGKMHKMVIELLKIIKSKANNIDEGVVQRWMDEAGLAPNRDFADWYADRLYPGEYHQDLACKTVHDTLVPSQSSVTVRVMTNVYCSLTSCRIFHTSSGYLGLGMKAILPGDIVCVVKGSSYPIILRKVDSHYVYVGICYVLGLMQGEAADRLGIHERELQEFTVY